MTAPAPAGTVTIVLHGYFSREYSGDRRTLVLPLAEAATPRAALARLTVPAGAVGLLLVGKQQANMDTPLQPGDTLDVLPLLGGGLECDESFRRNSAITRRRDSAHSTWVAPLRKSMRRFPMTTHYLHPKLYYYTFGPGEPLAHLKSGDTVIAETRDAMGNDAQRNPLPESMKQRIPGVSLRQSNPVVGPLFVDGAEDGDLLAVHIRRIRLNRDFALSKQSANFGSLTGETPSHVLLYNAPIESIWYEWKLDLQRNTGSLEMPHSRLGRVEYPLAPFIGSIGVAPRYGRVETTLTPGEYGGNMDCIETCEGTTLYLPVWAAGAYLSFGDIHALQGDGELNGTALEVTAEVTLHIELLRGRKAEWPRLENATHIMVAGSTRDLMDCVRLAQMELLRWLIEDYGFQREEAWQLNAQVGTMRIGNVVDPLYTVVAKFPKNCLPS